MKHASVRLPDAPSADAKDPRGNSKRVETITDLAFVDGKVIVAGLSNEEFLSSLRSIPYPFREADKGAGIEIFHGPMAASKPTPLCEPSFPITSAGHRIFWRHTPAPLVTIPVSN